MRTLTLLLPQDALTSLDPVLKQTKDVRVFRRAQAVRAVVTGQHMQAVSTAFHCTYSARRKWGQRFAHEGTNGLCDRPRPGRPRKVTDEVATRLHQRVAPDSCTPGAVSSPWSCRELGTVVARQTGGALHQATVRRV